MKVYTFPVDALGLAKIIVQSPRCTRIELRQYDRSATQLAFNIYGEISSDAYKPYETGETAVLTRELYLATNVAGYIQLVSGSAYFVQVET